MFIRSGSVLVINSSLIERRVEESDGLSVWGGQLYLSYEGNFPVVVRNLGIQLYSGSAEFQHTTIEGGGLGVASNGALAVSSTVVRGNSGPGVAVSGGGSLLLGYGSRVADNTGDGVVVSQGGRLLLGDATIENNGGRGVSASEGSLVGLAPQTLIRGNAGDGIHLADTSLVTGNLARIIDNGGWGILCDPAPAVAQIAGNAQLQVDDNAAGQVSCPTSP